MQDIHFVDRGINEHWEINADAQHKYFSVFCFTICFQRGNTLLRYILSDKLQVGRTKTLHETTYLLR